MARRWSPRRPAGTEPTPGRRVFRRGAGAHTGSLARTTGRRRPRAGGRRGGIAVRGLLAEFKTFVLRGNVVDLAVGIVIGVAFAAVVQALVKDLLTPLIAAIVGQPDFSALTFKIHRSVFRYGDFLNALIAFVTIAAA